MNAAAVATAIASAGVAMFAVGGAAFLDGMTFMGGSSDAGGAVFLILPGLVAILAAPFAAGVLSGSKYPATSAVTAVGIVGVSLLCAAVLNETPIDPATAVVLGIAAAALVSLRNDDRARVAAVGIVCALSLVVGATGRHSVVQIGLALSVYFAAAVRFRPAWEIRVQVWQLAAAAVGLPFLAAMLYLWLGG